MRAEAVARAADHGAHVRVDLDALPEALAATFVRSAPDAGLKRFLAALAADSYEDSAGARAQMLAAVDAVWVPPEPSVLRAEGGNITVRTAGVTQVSARRSPVHARIWTQVP